MYAASPPDSDQYVYAAPPPGGEQYGYSEQYSIGYAPSVDEHSGVQSNFAAGPNSPIPSLIIAAPQGLSTLASKSPPGFPETSAGELAATIPGGLVQPRTPAL